MRKREVDPLPSLKSALARMEAEYAELGEQIRSQKRAIWMHEKKNRGKESGRYISLDRELPTEVIVDFQNGEPVGVRIAPEE